MVVTWVTLHHVDGHTFVKYGRHEHDLNHKATAEVSKFVDDSKKYSTKFYNYRALMTDLKPNTKYCV